MIHRIILLYVGFLIACVSSFGQGTKADYERSVKIRQLLSSKVYKETMSPNWFGGHHFWYETKIRGVREYVIVNGKFAVDQGVFKAVKSGRVLLKY